MGGRYDDSSDEDVVAPLVSWSTAIAEPDNEEAFLHAQKDMDWDHVQSLIDVDNWISQQKRKRIVNPSEYRYLLNRLFKTNRYKDPLCKTISIDHPSIANMITCQFCGTNNLMQDQWMGLEEAVSVFYHDIPQNVMGCVVCHSSFTWIPFEHELLTL
jgi:hypothetical protein